MKNKPMLYVDLSLKQKDCKKYSDIFKKVKVGDSITIIPKKGGDDMEIKIEIVK